MSPLYVHPRVPANYVPRSPASPSPRRQRLSDASVASADTRRRALEAVEGRNILHRDHLSPECISSWKETVSHDGYFRARKDEGGISDCQIVSNHLPSITFVETRIREDIERAMQYQRRAQERRAQSIKTSPSYFGPTPSRLSSKSYPSPPGSSINTPRTSSQRSQKCTSPIANTHKPNSYPFYGHESPSRGTPSTPPPVGYINQSSHLTSTTSKKGHRSSRSRSSILLQNLSYPTLTRDYVSPPPSPTPHPVSPVKQLAPLSRFNPFARARSESLSSVIEVNPPQRVQGMNITPPQGRRLRRKSTMSSLFGRKTREAEVVGLKV